MNHRFVSELKSIARGKMLGKYNTAAGAIVLIELILFILSSIISHVVDMNSGFGVLMYICIMLIVALIVTIFSVGELTIYLNMSCDRPAKVTDIFSYFKVHPDKAILLTILMGIRMFVWLVPALVSILVYSFANETDTLLYVSLALYAIGFIGAMYTSLALSQCYYLLLDFPQYTAAEIIHFSKEIMKGHKWQLLYLHLSFIPMSLLAMLSMGIGMLFVYPYMKMTLTEFYLSVIRNPQQ